MKRGRQPLKESAHAIVAPIEMNPFCDGEGEDDVVFLFHLQCIHLYPTGILCIVIFQGLKMCATLFNSLLKTHHFQHFVAVEDEIFRAKPDVVGEFGGECKKESAARWGRIAPRTRQGTCPRAAERERVFFSRIYISRVR